ncbi:hypothetical protein [Streptomyces sp. NPDC001933]|uniref:hypothetical protein n=1 Tax=Streptomyces sp. NPDC001933 TaxID=3364626 RepID=UPI003698017E
MPDLPTPTRLSPIRDDHAWHFPWSPWHGVAPNKSGSVRKSVILRFGQLWIRPDGRGRVAEHTVARMTGERRICGHFGRQPDPMDWYVPTDQAAIMGREPATR